jgi:saccharopine dehydrogenase-like NADP-dependent oxidoreductase
MKILIVGAGAVASVLSRQLAKEKNITHITCASNDLRSAKEFIDTRNPKVSLARVDASKIKDVARAAKGYDLIINASIPRYNTNIMEAALKVNANYQDLCSELRNWKNPEQLPFHRRFKQAGLVGLINTGVAPGVTNLLAAEVAHKLDSVDEIKIRLIEDMQSSEFIFSWSTQVALDTIRANPLCYRNRRFIFLEPFGDAEDYEFPHPFGKKRLMNLYGDEIATLPLYLPVNNVCMKSGGADIDIARSIKGMGLLDDKPVDVKGKKVVPLDFFKSLAPHTPSPKEMSRMIKEKVVENAVFVSTVEGIGKQRGKSICMKSTVIYPDLKAITEKMEGATYISYPTGVSAAVFARIIPKIMECGVFPPEALSHEIRKEVLICLEKEGIVLEEKYSKA